MKLSLVVAQGIHQGKVIPIPVAQFIIGRDEGCQLRPASQAISKRHCAVLARGGRVFVRDFGSTNGTFVNDAQVTGEQEIKDGDQLKVGPLEFKVRIDKSSGSLAPSRLEPKPAKTAAGAETPAPSAETKADVPAHESESAAHTREDEMAAMLLATDDGPPEPITSDKIPEGSTVFDVPSMGTDPGAPKKPDEKKQETGDTRSAADAILRKYMRRPRT
ncbi:MAG TPA: FHA domain-containing protein [Gemmataceae bacterium]|jgi:predicted component of type VI protein secretion system|nr:FHA domain-containing protein [Gemmataceae bacterium]